MSLSKYYATDVFIRLFKLDNRWLSRDPIGERGGPNLYAFLGNDGVNRVDVLGLDDWSNLGMEDYENSFGTLDSYGLGLAVKMRLNGLESDLASYNIADADGVKFVSGIQKLQGITAKVRWESPPFFLGDDFYGYNKLFNTIYLGSEWTESDAIHELVHAYNRIRYTGIPHGSRRDEGMAYGMEFVYGWVKQAVKIEGLSRSMMAQNTAGSDCARVAREFQTHWTSLWATRWGPSNASALWGNNGDKQPLDDYDFRNLRNHLGVGISCNALAKILNESSVAKNCCLKFSCDKGEWRSEFSAGENPKIIHTTNTIADVFK